MEKTMNNNLRFCIMLLLVMASMLVGCMPSAKNWIFGASDVTEFLFQ